MPNNQTIISDLTRKHVRERQNNFSPFGNWLGQSCHFHHVIGSGLGEKGVGYEWNVIALTCEEHMAIHQHQPIKVYGLVKYTYDEAITIMKNHLKTHYPNWTEKKCKVHKGWEASDYEITRRNKL